MKLGLVETSILFLFLAYHNMTYDDYRQHERSKNELSERK